MAEYISREEAVDDGYLSDWYIASVGDESPVWTDAHIDELLNDFIVIPKDTKAADVKPVKKTEFQIGYEQGFNDGRASAALPNIIDNGNKIDGYTYVYKTDSRGEPYIHIDSVRNMLRKAADVQPIVYAHKTINVGRRSYCSNCGKLAIMEDFCSKCGAKVKDGEPTRNLTDEETEIYDSWLNSEAKDTGVNIEVAKND